MVGAAAHLALPERQPLRPSAATEGKPQPCTRLEALVHEQLPLVRQVVQETLARVPSHVGRDDLESAGMYALATSAKAFDATRGVPFGQYAAIRIRGAVADELRQRDWASRGVRRKARELDGVRHRLTAELGRTPSRSELAGALGVDRRAVESVEADVSRASLLSLQALTPEDGDELVAASTEAPEDAIIRQEQLGYLRDAIAELPERLRTVVTRHFFDRHKLAEIADDLGVTESRVSQLRAEAVSLLGEAMREAADGEPAPARPRAATRAAYCAAVARRSTVAERLTPLDSGSAGRRDESVNGAWSRSERRATSMRCAS